MGQLPSRLRRLDDALADLPLDEPMLLTELDGFLTGVLVCPELILPGEWLPVIWGAEESGGAPFDDPADAQWFTSALMARYNEIVRDLRRDLDGKVHLRVGTADSFYLDGAVHRLEAVFRQVGGHADITYVPGATHSMAKVYSQAGGRNAYWKDMTCAMYAIAQPNHTAREDKP